MRFAVRFLRHRGRALPWRDVINRPPCIGDVRIEETRDEVLAADEAAASAPPARTYRILIVDDNSDAAEALAALLEILGHEATIVHDGPAAIAAATYQPPDLVLLDLGLPGMDGVEVARRMRQMPELRSTRLVACTGYGSGNDNDAASIYDAGFEQRLVKPVTVADLQRILAT